MAEKNSATVRDYLRWRGDLTFWQDGFNEVDNLLLCIVSYIDFRRIFDLRSFKPSEAVSIGQVCALLTDEDEQLGLSEEAYIPVLRAMAATPRFRDMEMFAFESSIDEEKVMQFAAVSFLLPDHSVFIAYRGTDTTLVGWQENFNMSFLTAVPAQLRAAEYAQEIVKACPRRMIRIGGHSKGGNLAAWAAIHLPERMQRKRLLAAYNNDGPGFSKEVLASEEYHRVAEKIHTFIPESSVVGMLLEHTEDYEIIDSTNYSVMQHEPLSWNVMGHTFCRVEARTGSAQLYDGVVRDWLAEMDNSQRQEFIEALYSILRLDGKAKTLEDLRGVSSGMALLKAYIGADERKRKVLFEIFSRLAADVGDEIGKIMEQHWKAAGDKLEQVRRDWKKA